MKRFIEGLSQIFLFIGLLALVAVTIASHLGEYYWELDLLSHFRVQYFQIFCLLLIIGLVVLKSQKRVMFTVIALVFIATNGISIARYYLPIDSAVSDESEISIKILNMNVWVSNRNSEAVSKVIRETNADIITLNEYNKWWQYALSSSGVLKPYPYHYVVQWADNAIYSKFPITSIENRTFGPSKSLNQNPRALVSEIVIHNMPLQLVVVHPKPPRKELWAIHHRSFFQDLAQFLIKSDKYQYQIVAGDLNSTTWAPTVSEFLIDTGLKDTQLGFGVQPSWSTHHPYMKIPIDHVLVSPNVNVLERDLGDNVGSDHLPVIVELGLPVDEK